MIKHLSVFTLKNKEEIENYIAMLKEVGETCPLVTASEVGRGIPQKAPEGPGPDFGDVVQILTFKTPEDAMSYPQSEQHQKLIKEGPEMLKVTAIDWEC